MSHPLLAMLPAQQAQAAPGPDMSFFLMMGAIFLIFYFLVIRPQQQQRKNLEQSVKSAAKGDSVVTAGGLHGKIVATGDDTLTLQIATLKGGQSVQVQVQRSRIESVASKQGSDGKGGETGDEKKDEKKKGGSK